ncbi:MAG: glycosyltransferase family 4 protein [Deltaproteobacteria bacterium]|uniref:Glycosyltransferase family 4 protein n=1 Tax=Candidatus Zymogenus saltonus TaxID=2844893 RepID=A0A9D8KFW4_9DELT|nr:glycosyltransferase family 4 protein [Candidatus Zymogenus saltonus]
MRIVYAITYWGMTGGVKVMVWHVELLRSLGHDVRLVSRIVEAEWESKIRPEILPSFSDKDFPGADAIVVTTPRDVETLWPVAKKRGIPLFHFLQGFEPAHVLKRIEGLVVPEKYRSKGIASRLRYKARVSRWKKSLKRLDGLYRLPTVKMAISPHIVEDVEKSYGVHCYLLPNWINRDVFYSKKEKLNYSKRLKIVSVGNFNIDYKAIPDINEAVRILKGDGIPIHFTRVSVADIPEGEKKLNIADEFLVRINEVEISKLYRESHILISASTEIEGFGLPPVEAMSSGTPTILTRVAPFLAFDTPHDYSYFVDVHRPDQIAKGVIKLAEYDELRESIVARGFDVAEKYSIGRVGSLLEKILKDEA